MKEAPLGTELSLEDSELLKETRLEHEYRAAYRKAKLQSGKYELQILYDFLRRKGVKVTEKDIAQEEAERMDRAIEKEVEQGASYEEAIKTAEKLPYLKTAESGYTMEEREEHIKEVEAIVKDMQEDLEKGSLAELAGKLNILLKHRGYPDYYNGFPYDYRESVDEEVNATDMFSEELNDLAQEAAKKIIAANDVSAYMRLVRNRIDETTDIVDFKKDIFPMFESSQEFKDAAIAYMAFSFGENYSLPQNFINDLTTLSNEGLPLISMKELKQSDAFKQTVAKNKKENWFTILGK